MTPELEARTPTTKTKATVKRPEDINNNYKISEISRAIRVKTATEINPKDVLDQLETRIIKNYLKIYRHERI